MSFSPQILTIGTMILIVLMICSLFDCQIPNSSTEPKQTPIDTIVDTSQQPLNLSTIFLLSRIQLILILMATPFLMSYLIKFISYLIERRRVYNLIELIPGPPCHPIPFLGHAGIVLDLDRTKYKYGTYACKYLCLDTYQKKYFVFKIFANFFDPKN